MTESRSDSEKEIPSALMRKTKRQGEPLDFEKLLLETTYFELEYFKLVPSGKRAFGAEARLRFSCFGATNSKVS